MRNSQARLLYLCFEGLPKTVFDAQVLGFLKTMAGQGLVFDLFIFENPGPALRNYSWNAQRLKDLQGSWGGKVSYIPFGTKYAFPLAATHFLLSLAQDLKAGNRLVLHCRGNYSACLAALLKKFSQQVFSVYDVRGDTEAEFLYRTTARTRPGSFRRRMELTLLRWADGLALRKADRILCVSSTLKVRLRERWGLEGKAIDIIPSCADATTFRFDERVREAIRRRLALEGRFVLVYSGSMYRWQLINRISDIVCRLLKSFPHIHLLCLTPQLAEAESSLAASLPQRSYTLLHVPHAEIPGYLMAGDMGILIREDHPLNEVACPTKFAEYLMCGLPVLTTAGLGDVSELVEREKLGIVMKGLEDPMVLEETLVGFLQEAASCDRKARTAHIGREHFAWDRYASVFCEIYEKASSI